MSNHKTQGSMLQETQLLKILFTILQDLFVEMNSGKKDQNLYLFDKISILTILKEGKYVKSMV